MAKVSMLDLQIHVWMPMETGQRFIARIGDLPMIFFGSSALKERASADDFRRQEVAKVEAARDRAAGRVAAAKSARDAKKAGAATDQISTTTSTQEG